jgi:hypothetical protein
VSCTSNTIYPATADLTYRYFIHDEYAGISAFLNEPAPESERNASMLSVGVLVPLDYGRMGKSWLHAEELKTLARYDTNPVWARIWKHWLCLHGVHRLGLRAALVRSWRHSSYLQAADQGYR